MRSYVTLGVLVMVLACGEEAKPTPTAECPPQQQVQTYILRMQHNVTASTDDVFWESFVGWAGKVEEMSGGRIDVQLYGVGGLVPPAQFYTAVSDGASLDGGYTIPVFMFNRSRAASLFGAGPNFGLDADGFLAWMRYGGGQELYNQLLQKVGLNMVSFIHAPLPTQPLGWFSQTVDSESDLVGLKYRTAGLAVRLFKLLGADAVALPGGETISRLRAGTLHAAEFNNPTTDRFLGLHLQRNVYMVQSHHQTAETLEVVINKAKYESLPTDLRSILKYASMAQSADTEWMMMDRNSRDLKFLKDAGVQVVRTPDSILAAQLAAWRTVIAEESTDPFAAAVLDSQSDWARRVVPLRQKIVVDDELAAEHYFPGQ